MVFCLGCFLLVWVGVVVFGRLDRLWFVFILLDWFIVKLVLRFDYIVCLIGGVMFMMLIELFVFFILFRVCVLFWFEEGLFVLVFLVEKIKVIKKMIKIYLNVLILLILIFFNYCDLKFFIIFKIYFCMDYMYFVGLIYILMLYLNKYYL